MAEELQGAPPKKSKAKWFILIFVLLILGGGGAAAWHFWLSSMWQQHQAESAKTAEDAAVPKAAPMSGQIVTLPEFRVNLSDPLGKRFVKLILAVRATSTPAAEELATYQAPIRDAVILLLSSKTYSDLATTEGKEAFKGEIVDRLNQILGGPKIAQVFLTDLIIQ